jgi:hypothetical protein
VAVSPAPAPFVKEMNDAGQFYTNRVLKDWKEKNKLHVDWVKTWIQVLTELQVRGDIGAYFSCHFIGMLLIALVCFNVFFFYLFL